MFLKSEKVLDVNRPPPLGSISREQDFLICSCKFPNSGARPNFQQKYAPESQMDDESVDRENLAAELVLKP